MDKFIIRGGRPLHGEITIGGAKNAGLKLLVAGLLTSERLVLTNVPHIADIATMRALLTQHGLSAEAVNGDKTTLSVGGILPAQKPLTTLCPKCGPLFWCLARC
ncbi:UDP-N-acetylglucosamine 1-carboxyvinyltransferase [Acetobacter orientalis]|uniref:UDP-N-acetylglucosamine 1-carboxyvinyltransferase n=1 Tax=Acetobacter orientalis TaxID=146474 RepID=A0A2Z5ZGC1_9PROT|nr:UDP-N-acetylglucosamine 1-carboxyvinyltransferase [Acetobacter orientalis]